MAMSGFNHNVEWSEFRPVNQRPAGINEDAQISIRTQTFNFQTRQPRGENCRVTGANVSIVVNRGASWVVRGYESASLLQHEQGHYDITALGTRDLYNRVLALTAARCPDINAQSQSLQRQIQTQITQTNRRYDTQTNHGNNASAQSRWNTSIRSAMQSPSGTLANLPQ
ncbi:MAG: DUF922 domain-containing protein [Desulfobacterales bacterium]